MDIIKYVAFGLSFLFIILENFTKTRKDQQSPYKESTRTGRIFIIISILSFVVGIIQSISEDIQSAKKEAIAEVIRKRDSAELARRWSYDTVKFSQLLDSSRLIISNSIASIERSNNNLKLSDSILKITQQQERLLDENITLTNKQNFSLPYNITYQVDVEYKLNKTDDNSLISYLDSLAKNAKDETAIRSDGSKVSSSPNAYYLDFSKISHPGLKQLDNLLLYILGARIQFNSKFEPILRLKSNYLWQSDSWDFKKFFDFKYFPFDKKLLIMTLDNVNFKTQQQRKSGITSLVDLKNSLIFFSSSNFFPINEKKIERFSLNLNLSERSIYFYQLIPIFTTETEMIQRLKKFDIYTLDQPVFFDYEIKEEKLKGYSNSLRG